MTDSQKPLSSGKPDDPWEELAEDLFGLEYGKEHAAGEADSPGPASVPEPAPPPQMIERTAAQFPEPAGPEPEGIFEREPAVEPETAADADEFTFDDDEEVSESTESAPAEPVRAEPISPQDSYWDALANWNWDESEGGAGKGKPAESRGSERPHHRGGGRGREEGRGRRGGERPQRQSSPSAAPAPASPATRAPRTEAPSTPDDFGLGVVAPEPGFSPPVSESAAESPPPRERREQTEPASPAAETRGRFERDREGTSGDREERGPDGHRKRRRRRRRRRSRGDVAEQGSASAAPAIPGADWEDEGAASSPRADAEGSGEEFGFEQSPDRPEGRERHRGGEQPPRSVNAEPSFEDDEEELPEMPAVGGGELEP